MYLNSVTIVGHVTRDPEMRALPNGAVVVNFSIATNRTWKNKDTGAKKEEVEFHNLVAFRKTAEVIAQYVKKGQLLCCQGRLQTRSWEDTTGKKVYKTEIMVESMQMGPKAAGTGQGRRQDDAVTNDGLGDQPEAEAEINPEDIPY